MKTLPLQLIALTTFACLAHAADAEPSGKHLFILSGQSNMAGLDPSLSFTPMVESALGEENVIVVKSAQGGQPIRRWYKEWKPVDGPKPEKNGDLYAILMKKVNEAIEGEQLASVTLVWMQGERDAREGHAAVYAEALKGLVAQIAEDLDYKDVHFVNGRLSDFDLPSKRYRDWSKIRDIQVEVAEENDWFAWVDTDDLNDGKNKQGKEIKNDLHYSVKGYKELGRRFAEKAIALIEKRHDN